MNPVQFFFELASPYSYIASLQIERLVKEEGRAVEWRPIELEAVWAAQGVLEAYAAIRRVKRDYILRDSRRCAASLGIAIAKPATSSRDTSFAKLAFWGLHASNPQLATRFIQAVWNRHFGAGSPIASAHDLASASTHLGLSEESIVSAAQSPLARAAQDATNVEAVRSGCFGVPWFVADGEAFFGQDRLSHLAAHLNARTAA
jgi:2-hydroxychromene-2-carboxylate isomerase